MQAHERITKALRQGAAEGGALVPFMTAGYPEPDQFIETLLAVAKHADVVEIGVPFSDPMADGMTIQRSSFVAIEKGVSLRWILETLTAHRMLIDTPLVLMSYLNPLLAYGYDALGAAALEAGVCGFIVPDLPYEESETFREAMQSHGIGLVQLVTPATPADRLATLCRESRGFVYAVTITGITGGGAKLPAEVTDYLENVSEVSSLPVCAGFGIRSRADVEQLAGAADGVIVGSALVEVLERGDDPGAFLAALRTP
ncbi:MAG: tryptophan synthase subunit alpha [Pseudomonadota bacterium]